MAKKKIDQNNEEVGKKEIENKPLINKGDLFWMLAFVGAVIFGILTVYMIFNSMAKVEYEGLTFVKEKYEDLIFYKYVYQFNYDGKIITYNLYVRNDPSKNNVPVEGNEIVFPKGKYVYLTINETGINTCPLANVAVAGLSGFLVDNQLRLKTGVPDEKLANEGDRKYITCETNPQNPVIYIREGKETKIELNGSCYNIEIANCDVLKAIEKFEVQAVIDAKEE